MKEKNSAEFNFKETTLLFCLFYAKQEVKSQGNLSLKSSSNVFFIIFTDLIHLIFFKGVIIPLDILTHNKSLYYKNNCYF